MPSALIEQTVKNATHVISIFYCFKITELNNKNMEVLDYGDALKWTGIASNLKKQITKLNNVNYLKKITSIFFYKNTENF